MAQDADKRRSLESRPAGGAGEGIGESGCIEIDLGVVLANSAEPRRMAGRGRKIIATVKADVYGHGCVAIAIGANLAGTVRLGDGAE